MRILTLKSMLLLSAFISFGITLSAQENQQKEPMEQGIYEPTWESLSKYEVPEWFQDAKFGLWAHWGPQCQPESGDWYARHMYFPGHWQYNAHVQKYGNPSEFGFKDVINVWKAEKWDPDSLIRFYKSVGAKYFMTLANHHDNFDLWDSKYQPWNSVNMGPRKDIVGGWAEACKKYGLPLGVSVHASHTWLWMEGAQDFDGKLTKADGIGKWWEGYDPQDLYEQNHPRSVNSHDVGTIHSQWNWGNGAAQPTEAYKTKVYNRTIDLINKYHPDLIYYDDTAVPFYPISNEGLEMTAHLYNKSLKDNNGDMRAVVMGKILNEEQKECMLWDVERGVPDRPQPKYWQTCTCLGQWHYDRGVYDRNEYKSAATVIKMLVDVVSKNGNLLMSVPVRGDGSIDEKEVAILKDIKAWMDINGESIFGTRPWTVFGEGPNAESSNPLNNQGFNEGVNYVAEDIRYVKKEDVVYVTALGWSANNVMMLKNLSSVSPYYDSKISKVELLGYGEVSYVCDRDGLMVKLPTVRPNPIAPVLKVSFGGTATLTDLYQLQEVVVTDLDLAKQNIGNNTGQYENEYVNALDDAYQASKVSDGASTEDIAAVYLQLKKAYADFLLYGANKCVVLKGDEQAEDVTKDYLVEANNFSRSDEGVVSTSRFGLLGEPWVVTSNIINQDNFTTGGFDSYNSSKCIGVQKWYNTDPAIENGKIYQVTTLPAGNYNFTLSVHEQYGLTANEILFCVAKGKVLPDMEDVKTEALAYHDMVTSKTGGLSKCCYFTLEEETEICLGWSVSIAATAKEKSIRVNRVRLYKDSEHVSADYLKNYDRIQRKDINYPRFGVPQYWTVENFNVPQSNGDGIKLGIDKYPGYNTLMLGVWNDRASAVGDLSKARIYKKVTLPVGTYYFGASYHALYKIGHGFIFMSETLPETNSAEACDAYAHLSDASLNGNTYGIKFTLDKETEVYLGWMADLTKGDATQEFRANEISLLKYKETEGGGNKIEAVNSDKRKSWQVHTADNHIFVDCEPSSEVCLYALSGKKISDKRDTDGTVNMIVPSPGVYILSVNGETEKILIGAN